MSLFSTTIPQISGTAAFNRLVARLHEYEQLPNLGLARAARLPVSAALHAALGVPTLLVTDRADHALTLQDELSLWLPETPCLLFPEPAPLFYERVSWGETTRIDRLSTLTALAAFHIPGARPQQAPQNAAEAQEDLSRAEARRQIWTEIRGRQADIQAPLIIASARSLMARTLPRRDFVRHTHSLKVGLRLQPSKLAEGWVAIGYEAANIVVQPGQFARRGGLVDIWPPTEAQPLRIDFFGDEIDTLRRFDPSSQRTTDQVQQVLVSPAREFILSGEIPNLPDSDAGTLATEFHLPLLHAPASLLEYLPDKSLVLLDDLEAIESQADEVERQAVEMRLERIADGRLPKDFPTPYTTWSELFDSLSYRRYLQLGPAAGPEKSDLSRLFTPNPRFGGRVKALSDHLLHQAHRKDRSIVVSRQASRLDELWRQDSPPGTAPAPLFVAGSLEEGFIFSPPGENRIHLLTDGEIFGWRRTQVRRRPRGYREAPEIAYADLQVGDWVVHIDHGIGRFMGLVNRSMESVEREYLAVEYDEGDELFVPVHHADRLTRYVGPDGRAPQPSRLGSAQWATARARVKKAVEDVAEDLLELYSRRSTVQGHAFSPDSDWQRELEAAFLYTETDDQLLALEEVKKDMERPRPMDRLICGDVGYGKTEVALRATFKAVYDGKQVAMLVPTTVLAQQHFYTFRERLAPFPVVVEMLSRFRTDAEQRDVLFRLANGEVDVVIGTHRLLSGDVEFSDLGLLIIDEEQRFGVTHKEKLKQMRTEVDVLTLTATPIPRTMYMALTGVRDISTINTPPEERLPIITQVGPYSQKQVRQAILREMERGGQVFFVHNRVQTIYGMRSHLEKLVPEARIGVAHGQMKEKALSDRMQAFTQAEIDVLLSTSIIESGLDIPNANTLIVDRADTFGLAQLYQLRGRVGRGSNQAYAYFFKHRRKPATPEGRARLDTLAENTELGAGFNIAMRDLEIRGAGDLLGTRQSGHIAAVGFHLYTRLLSSAVQEKRGHRLDLDERLPLADLAAVQAIQPPINIDLPIPAGIPSGYIADRDVRLQLYRRLADVRRESEIETLESEFNDRFGPVPDQVRDLFFQIRVKLLAEKAGIQQIVPENRQLVLRFRPGEEARLESLPFLGRDVRTGKNAIRLLAVEEKRSWRERLLKILAELAGVGTN
jgi:transcription-repair coupling factor (superfamily II helicase)